MIKKELVITELQEVLYKHTSLSTHEAHQLAIKKAYDVVETMELCFDSVAREIINKENIND